MLPTGVCNENSWIERRNSIVPGCRYTGTISKFGISVCSIGQRTGSIFFEYIQISGSKVIAKVEDIDSKDDALKLVSKTLHLPLTALPKLPTGSYYYHDLVGFDFFDQGKLLGKVTSIYNMTSQNIMVVDHAGAEILVPMSDEIILNMDTTEKSVQADLPEGLIELYSTRDED